MNEQIRAREVRVISETGGQIGIFPVQEALKMAYDLELDLVEVAADARPPVCRILDFGKYKYEQKKKTRGGAKKGHAARLKGVRLHPKTEIHDLEVKTKQARGFLTDGDKVQFTVIFRGREMARQDLGITVLQKVSEMLADVAKVEKAPHMEGKRMHMIVARK
ncbi:MAG: translation initiation factor IF-3 [Planctomycetota bacterium]